MRMSMDDRVNELVRYERVDDRFSLYRVQALTLEFDYGIRPVLYGVGTTASFGWELGMSVEYKLPGMVNSCYWNDITVTGSEAEMVIRDAYEILDVVLPELSMLPDDLFNMIPPRLIDQLDWVGEGDGEEFLARCMDAALDAIAALP